jgi:flagellar basal body-associated protein FliL
MALDTNFVISISIVGVIIIVGIVVLVNLFSNSKEEKNNQQSLQLNSGTNTGMLIIIPLLVLRS